MNGIRFDALLKTWTAEANRRRTLAGMLAGAIAALGLADAQDADAARSGRCRKPCGQCQFCKKGKCRRKDGEKRCRKGKCKNLERGTPCAGGDGDCACGRSIEGDAFCAANAIVKCDGACANSGECPTGSRCFPCGGSTACFPECGTV